MYDCPHLRQVYGHPSLNKVLKPWNRTAAGPKFNQEKAGMRNIVKHGVVFVIALACMAVASQAQSLTPADRDKAMKYLESTKQGVADATKGLSAAQWTFKPAPDKWSVAEVTEHIAAAEDYIRGMVVEK